MSRKLEINIDGYGKVTIIRPKNITKSNWADSMGDAVAKTCNLLVPSQKQQKFHMVLGVENTK